MAVLILLALILVPVAEIAVFVEVGGRIGVWPTVGTIILTALVGTALLRQQGLSTLLKVQESLEQNRFPVAELFDGLCLLVAGALLLTPGFVTDAVGLLLFVPVFRSILSGLLWRRLVASGHIKSHSGENGATVIEGEFHEVRGEDDPSEGADDHSRSPPELPR